MRYGAKTDKGMLHSLNEDNFCMANLPEIPFALFAVADGVGGLYAGEVASEIAAEVFADSYQKLNDAERMPEPAEFLSHTAQNANEAIIRHAYETAHNDMGTTLVACAVTENRIFTLNFLNTGLQTGHLHHRLLALCGDGQQNQLDDHCEDDHCNAVIVGKVIQLAQNPAKGYSYDIRDLKCKKH